MYDEPLGDISHSFGSAFGVSKGDRDMTKCDGIGNKKLEQVSNSKMSFQ